MAVRNSSTRVRAAAYGLSFVTSDLDVCAILTPDNIEKLRKVLADINPKHPLWI